MIKSLEETLAYKNKFAIDRFKQTRPDAAEEADLIFDDLKRFLWLVATQEERKAKGEEVPDLSFAQSMLVLDDMWHAFILCTNFYTEFCNEYFGNYIHHPTDMPKYIKNTKTDGMEEEEAMSIFLTEMITRVIEEFGEEIAERWFDYYAKYPFSGMH
ncbi:MAG: hypothetical protein ACI8X3_003485 [Saprospiraceae bacterium]